MNSVFFVRETLIKIENTPFDRSAALVLTEHTAAAQASAKSDSKFGHG